MEKVRRAEAVLVRLESAALVALLSVMVGLSFWQVAQRQLFGTGVLWADTLLRHLVVVVGFLGAAIAAAEGKHFGFELLAHSEGPKGRALRALANAAGAVVSALLAGAAWRYFLEERAAGGTLFTAGSLTVPTSWFAITLPIGFALVLIHLALAAASDKR